MASIALFGDVVKDEVRVQKHSKSGEIYFTRWISTLERFDDGAVSHRADVTIYLGFDQGAETYLAQWGLKPRDAE